MEITEIDLPFLRKQRCSVPFVMRQPQGTSNRGEKKSPPPQKSRHALFKASNTKLCYTEHLFTAPAMLVPSPGWAM